jgi:hypothetical protein
VKLPRLLAVWFLIFGTSIFCLPFANAENTGQIHVTCAKDDGTTKEFGVGWDNTTQFFEGKGNIAALFCKIASGGWETFVSTTAPESTWYYNGIAPTPVPTPEPSPSPSVEPTPTPSPVPVPEPSPSPTVKPTVEPSPVPTVSATPEPSATNTPESSASPSPSVSETSTAVSYTHLTLPTSP